MHDTIGAVTVDMGQVSVWHFAQSDTSVYTVLSEVWKCFEMKETALFVKSFRNLTDALRKMK